MRKPCRIAAGALIAVALALVFGCTTTAVPVPEDGVTVVAAAVHSQSRDAYAQPPPAVGQTFRPGDTISLAAGESVTLRARDGRTWTLAPTLVHDDDGTILGSDYTLVKEPDDEDRDRAEDRSTSESTAANATARNALVTTGIVTGSVVALAATIEGMTDDDDDQPPPLSP